MYECSDTTPCCMLKNMSQDNPCQSDAIEIDTGYNSYYTHAYSMTIMMQTGVVRTATDNQHQHDGDRQVESRTHKNMEVHMGLGAPTE